MHKILIDTQIFQTLLYSSRCCQKEGLRMQLSGSIPTVAPILFYF